MDCSGMSDKRRQCWEQKVGCYLQLLKFQSCPSGSDWVNVKLYQCPPTLPGHLRASSTSEVWQRHKLYRGLQGVANQHRRPRDQKLPTGSRVHLVIQRTTFIPHGRSVGEDDWSRAAHPQWTLVKKQFYTTHTWSADYFNGWSHGHHELPTFDPISTDAEMPQFLSPAMLLTQKASVAPAPPGDYKIDHLHKSQWQQVQSLADAFWKRWKQEYLSTLQPRKKWTENRTNLQEGDVVLLKDCQVKCSEWPIRLITKTIPSSDNRVCKVMVKTSKQGTVKGLWKAH